MSTRSLPRPSEVYPAENEPLRVERHAVGDAHAETPGRAFNRSLRLR
jgi:hypothetical protein